MADINFDDAFKALTDNDPFPWQRDLYANWFSQGKFPTSCNLPTGLGKTSVIAVWLIALANGCAVPRRLVYVVNRRTVVDQTTDEVEKYRRNLEAAKITDPLAISTLRGQFADNREWSADPSRPAVICGTVDMIGSRLLFSGYGCGFKTRPLHAGFLGQDALIVHDEAHLEPAFQELLMAIKKEQHEGRTPDFRPLKVMELTATSRADEGEPFGLSADDYENDTVQKRIGAKKALHLHENKDEKKLADEIAELALKYKDSGRAVLVFVRKVDDVEKVTKKLPAGSFEKLTGTLRGLERDNLVKARVFQRFLPKAEQKNETVYLVCTSAGEVGVNISADHLVCDLSTFESMAQRFGRVNRFGERTDTEIDVVHPKTFADGDKFDSRLKLTLGLLELLNGDASPSALTALRELAIKEGSNAQPPSSDCVRALRDYVNANQDSDPRLGGFAPQPVILPTSDILFDAWALTTIRDKLPGRPVVEPYLHGISDYEPPQTTIAWRDEVELLTPDVLQQNKLDPETVLELFPLKPHEELSAPTYGKNKVFEQLEGVAARDVNREPNKRLSAWVIDQDGTVAIYTLAKLVEKDKQNKPVISLGGRTVLLPPNAGGFSSGVMKGDEPHTLGIIYDVSDQVFQDAEKKEQRRIRLWEGDTRLAEVRKVMRLVRSIDFPAAGNDEDTKGRSWFWFERPRSGDDEGSKTAVTKNPITWNHHTDDVTQKIKDIVSALGLTDELQAALILSAKFHDLGKKREVWQRSIGNPNPKGPPWYAKSGRGWVPREITDYRHEFGSVVESTVGADLISHPHRDLILHVIATHHGYARPHFPKDRAFDPESKGRDEVTVAREVPQRFARLQRKYGRWGLAYLESLLRAADYAASAKPSEFVEEETL